MGIVMSMLGQSVGFPVPRGGAGELTQALARRLRARGGTIRCGVEVEGLEVRSHRVRAVRTSGGEERVRRAVVAGVTAPQLYGSDALARRGLLDPDDVPQRVRRGMRDFTLDPGTVKVDWALSGPVPWAGTPAYAPGTVHVADDVVDMTSALAEVASGLVPARPFMLAGQMTTTDPTRSPEGTESFWAYTHVPQQVSGDAGEEGITGAWDHDECERFADRMQARFEALAPGFGSVVASRRVLGPHELESRDANLIGGAVNGGTSQLHQELVFRPVPGLGRAETGVPGPLPGVGLGPPRRRRARRRGHERRPRRPGPRPAGSARPAGLTSVSDERSAGSRVRRTRSSRGSAGPCWRRTARRSQRLRTSGPARDGAPGRCRPPRSRRSSPR